MKVKSILLIGLGRFGRHIAMRLNEVGQEVMAVDQDEDRVNKVLPMVTSALIGDSTDPDFLASLGIRNFDTCIVAIGDDFQASLETTDLLRELGANYIISRACSDIQAKFLLRNGADSIAFPERQLAEWIAIRSSSDNIIDYFELDHDHAIYEISVPKDWADKTVSALDTRKRFGINILAIKRKNSLDTAVTPGTILEQKDTILILGKRDVIQHIIES